jgi:hypothetical protein
MFVVAAELEAFQVPEDTAFPMHAKGYVVSFTTFYERGYNMPPHRFLCSLLQYYGLKLHHLTPSGIWHIAPFKTLCESYLGINTKLDLWMYFFTFGTRKILKLS